MRPWLRNAAIVIGGLVIVAIAATYYKNANVEPAPIAAVPEEASTLSHEQRTAVARAIVAQSLPLMDEIKVDSATGFVVATFTLTDSYRLRLPVTLQELGEKELVSIRSVLKPAGFLNYRVNVNGPPPGVGLVTRFGSSRSVEGGPIEWLTP